MAGLLNTWNALTLQKRIVLIGAVLATLVLVGMVARMATQPTMKLLYGGLDPQTSGEVLAAIEAMNVPVELRGDAIYVPADQKDRVRIELAKDNLPERGQEGYTLLENLSGFGTTSEMFNSALNRALEGELAHTIRSLPGVRSARVHITPAQRRAFQRDRTPPSASVAVRSASGTLSENAANSIQVMVALAVSGLEPQRVAVIDADNGSVIAGPEQSGIRSAATRALELSERHRMELEQMLELHVGEGNARVTVTVETDTDSETIFERRLDPESQVTMNAQTVETTNAASGSNAAVTVASNLPDGEAAAGRDRESNSSETRETFTYQYSETRRDQVKQAGGVKRIGVAVVLNEARSVAEDGAVTYTPRSEEDLQRIESLVRSAIAFDEARGDTITVESLRFSEGEEIVGLDDGSSALERALAENLPTFIQIGVLALVAIALGLFVVRPILSGSAQEQDPAFGPADGLALEGGQTVDAALAADADVALDLGGGPQAALTGEDDPVIAGAGESAASEQAEDPALGPALEIAEKIAAEDAELEPSEEVADVTGDVKPSTVDALRSLVQAKPEQSAILIKQWLDTSKDKATWQAR